MNKGDNIMAQTTKSKTVTPTVPPTETKVMEQMIRRIEQIETRIQENEQTIAALTKDLAVAKQETLEHVNLYNRHIQGLHQ
jgi:uncharacterized coiled-coil protein SlyX